MRELRWVTRSWKTARRYGFAGNAKRFWMNKLGID
jgi:hypothetical protein